jgi:hypothetical protein
MWTRFIWLRTGTRSALNPVITFVFNERQGTLWPAKKIWGSKQVLGREGLLFPSVLTRSQHLFFSYTSMIPATPISNYLIFSLFIFDEVCINHEGSWYVILSILSIVKHYGHNGVTHSLQYFVLNVPKLHCFLNRKEQILSTQNNRQNYYFYIFIFKF